MARETKRRWRRGRRRGGLGLLRIGLGAGLMYLFDPDAGRRRRSLARDKALHLRKLAERTYRKGTVDLRHRAEGLAAETRARLDRRSAPPEILVARVRAKMGTVVSHPRAIEVKCEDGVVTFSGPILAHEAGRLLRKAGRIPGVHGIVDRLERHATGENVPALQAGHLREERPELLQVHWAPGIRLAAVASGSLLAIYGRARGGLFGAGAFLAGAGLVVRAAANLPLDRVVGLDGGYRAVDVQKDIHVDAPVEEVYAFLLDIENLPRFMAHLVSVERLDAHRSHWVAEGPAGLRLDWDSELTRQEENALIAWRSLAGSTVRSAGVVRFEKQEGGGTRVEVQLSYSPPAGMVGHAVASLFGRDAKAALDDDLLRLKSLLENGRARAHGEAVRREDLAPGGTAPPA